MLCTHGCGQTLFFTQSASDTLSAGTYLSSFIEWPTGLIPANNKYRTKICLDPVESWNSNWLIAWFMDGFYYFISVSFVVKFSINCDLIWSNHWSHFPEKRQVNLKWSCVKLAPLCNLNFVAFLILSYLPLRLLWLVKRLAYTIELNSIFIKTWLKWKCIGVRIGNYFLTAVLNVTPKWIFWTKAWFLIIITFAMFSYKLANSEIQSGIYYIYERERERKRERAIRTYDAHVTPVLDRAYTNVVVLSNVILTTRSRAFLEHLMLCTAKLAD